MNSTHGAPTCYDNIAGLRRTFQTNGFYEANFTQ